MSIPLLLQVFTSVKKFRINGKITSVLIPASILKEGHFGQIRHPASVDMQYIKDTTHLLKDWVANSNGYLTYMSGCWPCVERRPPLFLSHPTLPAPTLLCLISVIDGGTPLRVNLASWIMHVYLPPLHSASWHGVNLAHRWNQGLPTLFTEKGENDLFLGQGS